MGSNRPWIRPNWTLQIEPRHPLLPQPNLPSPRALFSFSFHFLLLLSGHPPPAFASRLRRCPHRRRLSLTVARNPSIESDMQISRSIGDVYLKKAEYNREPLYAKFRVREPFKNPILSAEPSITVTELLPEDQFLIFSSDGLWEHLRNQEAVDIVHSSSCNGSARKLVKAALQEAEKKREMRYSELKKIEQGVRRHFHDDITMIIVFLDSNLISRASSAKSPVSLRGGGVSVPARSLAAAPLDDNG
ncbi:hypothetical protein Droror1_Dr00027665 [Drosera rotundifolia]